MFHRRAIDPTAADHGCAWVFRHAGFVVMQLFSYHVARHRGCEIGQPRNLAKSVTVE